jgi:hypothetical protein
MAISVKLLRTGSAASSNTFVVTAGSGDTGKLQIQFNSSDIYNNLSGSTADISSGASNSTITIPLNSSNEIPSGVYYFNFVADVGSSDTSTINFQVPSRTPDVDSTSDVYAPSFRVDDETGYTVSNGTVSAATRSLTLEYPAGSNQANLSASASDTTTALYVSTANVWTGSMQTTLAYDVTYTIAATTGYDTFTYQESGNGYNTLDINPENDLCDVYDGMENLRLQVNNADSKKRNDYAELIRRYSYSMSLAGQFREAVNCGKTSQLNSILEDLKSSNALNTEGTSSTASSLESRKVYGIGGTEETTQDIVGEMFEDATNFGINATYDDSGTGTVILEGRANFMRVYNDTGSTLSKGKAVYITGYDSATGLNEVSLASNASAASAEAIGLIYADIASAASGRCLINGWFESVDTSSFSVGDMLFLSTSGDLTATEPAATSYSQYVATVGEASTTGQMFVSPQKSINFNEAISAATVITDIENDNVKVNTAVADLTGLNTTPVQIIAGASGRMIQIHSAAIVFTSTPSPTPSGTIDFKLLYETSATYTAGKIYMTATFPTSAVSGDAMNFVAQGDIEYQTGDSLYLATDADEGTWDNAAKVIIFYSLFTP